MEKVLLILNREIELAELEKNINAKVKTRMGKTQRDYYLGEKVKEIQSEMGQNENGLDEMGELEETIKKKSMPEMAREKALKELKKLKSMPPMSAETTVVRNYIDCIVSLPWDKKSKSKIDINKAEKILDEDHYGLDKPRSGSSNTWRCRPRSRKSRGRSSVWLARRESARPRSASRSPGR
jgi:ATP-dependent Lon protease